MTSQNDCFALPRFDDTLDTLAGARWFSTLDMEKRVLAGGVAFARQRENGIFHGTRTVAIHGHAVWTL
jgi:hypothetical protein